VIRLIKRYESRKLYDTEESRYVSLDEIGAWIREGQEVRVVDNSTSEDVTAQTLAQVILEMSRRGNTAPPTELLHEMIRRGGELLSTGVGQLQQGVDRLLQASLEKVPLLRHAREETSVLRRRLDELEQSLARMEARVVREAASETEAAAETSAQSSGEPRAPETTERGQV
jgi:polyhydroxyalkanoate synthesis repressor PhaR